MIEYEEIIFYVLSALTLKIAGSLILRGFPAFIGAVDNFSYFAPYFTLNF